MSVAVKPNRQQKAGTRAKLIAHAFAWGMLLPGLVAVFPATAFAAATGEEDLRAIATFTNFDGVPTDAEIQARGLTLLYRFNAIPAVVVLGGETSINSLKFDPDFVELEFDRPLDYFLNTATVSTRVTDVWGPTTDWRTDKKTSSFPVLTLPGGVPIDGRGITVGVVDSGVNALHPDLWYAPLADGTGFTPKVKACVNSPTVAALDQPYCDETVGHGTHVAGIVAGNGWAQKNGLAAPLSNAPYVGAAPGAQLVASGLGAAILVIDATTALDWMYTVRNTYDISVVTNSWGDTNPACSASFPSTGNSVIGVTNKLVDAGITVLFAASNYDTTGNPTWTSTYARNPKAGVISVANYNDANSGTRDGSIATGSSDGCVKAGGANDYVWTWPDVAAPGTSIVSTTSYTGTVVPPAWNPPFYGSAGGTSMATPHVAGIVALMKQAYPDITPAQVERIIVETSTPWTDAVTSRTITGTTNMWGTNTATTGWATPETCKVTPADAAKAIAGDASVNTKFPSFTLVPNPDLYVCRDYRRGHGLVDAYAAVARAIALRNDTGPDGTPEVTISTPVPNQGVAAGLTDVAGLVNRDGGAVNQAPVASLSADKLNGPSPLSVTFTLSGTDSDGVIASWSLDYGDGAPLVTGTGPLAPTTRTHSYTDGSYTATLTVVDDDGDNDTDTVSISVGGLPVADGTIVGETHAYNQGGVGLSNVVALVTGATISDAVPKYLPGMEISIQSRSAATTNPQFPIDENTPAFLYIFAQDGTRVAGPIAMAGAVENPTLGSGYSYNAGAFTIPVDWSGIYYLAPQLTTAGSSFYMYSNTFQGLKPIEVIGAGSEVPGIPGTTPGSDEGHSIGDPDDDGLTPMGEIEWADVSTTATEVKAVIKVGQVPPQPAGDSPFLYAFNINNVDFESYMFGAHAVYDTTNQAVVAGATTTWDPLTNLVSINIPRTYLAGLLADCPCTGFVEARIGEGLAGGLQVADRAPNAGAVSLSASWQPGVVKGIAPAVAFGSQSDPEATDPAGDSVGGLGWMDITKIWVSRETATQFDVTLQVSDMSSMPPSVPGLGTNYQIEFCLDNNGAGGYTGARYTGVSAICYRASASSGVLGPAFGMGVIQKDASGSCGFTDMMNSLDSKFNVASNTVTWVFPRAALNVSAISGGVGDCSGLTPPTRGGSGVVDGTILTRLNAGTGHKAGEIVTLSTTLLGDTSGDGTTSRAYTFGAVATPLAVTAGTYSGTIDVPVSLAPTITGGQAPYSCVWTGAGAVFANANTCSTTVTYAAAGAKSLTLTVTDSASTVKADTASVSITGAAGERVDVLIGAVLKGSVTTTTDAQTPTANWAMQVDLAGYSGATTLVANWYDAGNVLLATKSVTVNVGGVSGAIIDITSPQDDPAGDHPQTGVIDVTGTAGHAGGAGGAQLGLNKYGFPITSGARGGLRATVTLEGSILAPCASCQGAPGGALTGDDQLATSVTWWGGPGDTNGVDGYWFEIGGYAGANYTLTAEFGSPMDIVFFQEWAGTSIGANRGPADTKSGTVPALAEYAFVYMRRVTQGGATDLESALDTAKLTLTPQIVAPSAPQGVMALAGDAQVSLAWGNPANDGGELLGFRVRQDGATIATFGPNDHTTMVTGLNNGQLYSFVVSAYNSIGETAAAAVTATPTGTTTGGDLAITSPVNGATGVPASTGVSGAYKPGGNSPGGTGNFANTHYFILYNLNDNGCGDPLGYGDHVIAEKLINNAKTALGVPAANIHFFNEDGGALTRSVDAQHYDKLSPEMRSGGMFEGPATFAKFSTSFTAAMNTAAANEAAGGAPARAFIIHSSHGLWWPAPLNERVFGSMMCLQDDVTDYEFGTAITNALDGAEAANPGVDIEVAINIDCSFCGGFGDSPLWMPGTTTTAVDSAKVVGKNRVLEVGCTWITECFGNPAVTYDHMYNECAFTGKADGFGPMIVTGENGTTGGDIGNDFVIPSATHHAKDGIILFEEAYWCALETVRTAGSLDYIGIQQMFQIVDNMDNDMFGTDGFILYDFAGNSGLGERDLTTPLVNQQFPALKSVAADPEGDGLTPYTDLLSIDASVVGANAIIKLTVADLSHTVEFEDVIAYNFYLNSQRFEVCYDLGSVLIYDWGAGAASSGTAVYDIPNNMITATLPLSELSNGALPVQVYATSAVGPCITGAPVPDDRIPDGTATVATSSGGGGGNQTTPGSDEVRLVLTGPGAEVRNAVATLNANASTWSYQPTTNLATGVWTVEARHLNDAGTGFVLVDGPVSVSFTVGAPADTEAPTAPGTPTVTGKTTSSISLSWTAATDNVGVDHYDIYRGGVYHATRATTTFTDSGLAADTTYTYTVKAIDAAGNVGPASGSVQATTDAIQTGTGTVTLEVDGNVVGTTSIDTSTTDPNTWTIPLDTDALSVGAHTLRATYDDGEGNVASKSITIYTGANLDISITEPTNGATVTPDFTVAGTTLGTGGPAMPAAGSFVLPDGTIDPTHAGYQLAASGALATLDAAFANAAGYTGIAPALDGALVVNVYFTGAAPSNMHEDLVPAGWSINAVENVAYERARIKYDAVIDLSVASARREGPPVPTTKTMIGPGSHILMSMAGGTYGCTANFVWKDESTGKYYLGAAGHCFLPEDKTATHGAGADYNRLLTSVRVCTAGCTNGGQTGFIITGTMTQLGNVAYARQTASNGDVGNDFGIVEIPASLYSKVDPRMPVWNGPSKEGTMTIGAPTLLYGNAAGFGEVYPTMARAGVGSVFGNANYWSTVIASAPGDSGSSLVKGVVDPSTNVINGVEALGALTHLSGAGPVVGTTMTRAKAMAQEAGITIRLVVETEAINGGSATAPGAPTLNTLTPTDTQIAVAWSAPASDGGSAITGYTVKYGTSPGVYPSTKAVAAGTLTTSVTGLTNGQTYHFVVTATNAIGESVVSNTKSATPQASTTVPSAPTNLVGAPGDAKVTLGWDEPNNGGAAITSYTVEYGTTSGAYTAAKTVSNTNTIVTGLTNNVTHYFVVYATNVNGNSARSAEVSAKPVAGSLPAYSVQVRVGGGAWTAAADYDGSSWSVPVTGAAPGILAIEAQLVKDGAAVASDTVLVTVESVNTVPVASAGPDKVADEGTSVTLFGSVTDPDAGDSHTFTWTQLGGTSVVLSGANTANLEFVAPQLNANETLTFRLTVRDAAGAEDFDDVDVSVIDLDELVISTVNGGPANPGATVTGLVTLAGRGHVAGANGGTANAAPTAVIANVVTNGLTVSADGSGSFDTDGTVTSYSWALGNGATAVGPTLGYTYPAAGSYSLILTVRDDRGAVGQAVYGPFSVVALPPTTFNVDAGDSQHVLLGTSVTLSASAYNPTGAVNYVWDTDNDNIADTAGQAISVNTTGMTPGVKTFKVFGTDGSGSAKTDTVKVLVYTLTTTPQTFSNTVLVGAPDEDPGASGVVDGATYHHAVNVLPGATLLDAELTWGTYAGVVPANPSGLEGGPNDFDLFAWSPQGGQDKSSADFNRPESVSIAAPQSGAWDFEVRSYVVVADAYTLRVNVTQAPTSPMPVVSQVNNVCFETSSQQLHAASTGNGVTGAWDLDFDGTFETAGMTATTNFAPGSGAHLARFRATTSEGYRSTILVAFRVDTTCVGAPSVVVIAVADTGINPYNKEFAGELVPYPALRDHTKADLANLGPGDVPVYHKVTGELLPFTKHPSSYIPGFPADTPALKLTLGGGYYKTNDNAAIWNQGHTAIPLNQWFWIPGTKFIGVVDGTDVAAVNSAADATPIFDDDGHGTGATSVSAGNTVGACPRCVLVFAEGLSSDSHFFAKSWIDFVSVSGGSPANVGFPLITREDATKAAAQRGQTISYAAGNGNANAYESPMQTYLSNSLGPDWTINVGATNTGNTAILGTGKPVDWSSYGSGSIPRAATTGYGTSGSFSGTSAATPISTGYMADALLNARIAMGDTLAGQKTTAQANGQRQAVAVGTAVPGSSWLADGVLTRAEMWNVAYSCASNFGNGLGYPANGPRSPVDYAYGGYGVADAAMRSCATNALLNGVALTAKPDADAFFENDEAIRDALWGDWDGNGNGQQGGSHNRASSTAMLPHAITFADVATGDKASKLLREVLAFNGVATSGTVVTETYYVHRDACGGSGDNSLYADRTFKAAAEGGHGCSSLAGTATNNAWTSRVPTDSAFSEGSTVTATMRAFSLRPNPGVVMTGTLLVDGVAVGSGASAPVDVITVGLVTTPCSTFVMTFPTTAAIPAGATVTFRATTPAGTQDMPMCYEGGAGSSRFVISGSSGGGGGGQTPTATITSPTQGEEVTVGETVTVTGTATFPAQAAEQKLYLRRDNCVNLNTDTLYLSPIDGEDAGNGCALTAGAAAPAQNFVEKYVMKAAELPVALGAGGTITGKVYFNTQGADPAQVELRVQSSEGLVGKQTVEVLTASVGGVPGASEVLVAIPVSPDVAGKTLTSLTFEIALLRQGAVHWTEYDNPASFIVLPRLGGPVAGTVEVALDDATFATGTLVVTGSGNWTADWTAAGEGAHTIYARARTAQGPGPVTSVGIVVAGGGTGGSGSVQVQYTQGATPTVEGWLPAAFDAGAQSWNHDWNTQPLANGGWTFHVQLLDDNGGIRKETSIALQLSNVHAPVLDDIANAVLDENQTLAFTVTATDIDGDALTYTLVNAPANATINPTTGAFTWTPTFSDAGLHQVTVNVTDTTGLGDEATFDITVANVNRAPTLAPIGNRLVAENATLEFTLVGSDPDSEDTVTYTALGLPAGATFNNATGAFSWTPTFTQAGNYDVTFVATDGDLQADETVTLTVGDVNRKPVMDAVADVSTPEAATIAFTVTGNDPDGDTVTFEATGIPAGATFDTDTGAFSWTPTYDDSGDYAITFRAADGQLVSANKTMTLTVIHVNRAPTLDAVGDKTVAEAALLSFTLTGNDDDVEDTPTFGATGLPAGATLDNATGEFAWTPTYEQSGSYTVTFRITDGALTAEETITIVTNHVNRAPTLDAVADKTVDERATLTFTVTGSDPDVEDTVTFRAENLPAGATFDQQTGNFSWTPTINDAGVYSVTLVATDGELEDNQTVRITVVDVPPAATNAATGKEYATIQDAINDVPEGGAINVVAGNHTGPITVNKRLTISGAGAASTRITAPSGAVVTVTAPGVTIEGFTIIAGQGGFGIKAPATPNSGGKDLVIRNNVIQTSATNGDIIGSEGIDARAEGALIEGNVVRGFANDVFLRPYGKDTIVRGNAFHDASQGITTYGLNTQITNNFYSNVLRGVDVKEIDTSVDASGTGNVASITIRDNQFAGAILGVRAGANTNGVIIDARLNSWGVDNHRLVEAKAGDEGVNNRILTSPYRTTSGGIEPTPIGIVGSASHTGTPAVCNALDGDGDGVADAYHDGTKCQFLTVQAAILAAHADSTIVLPVGAAVDAAPRVENIVIGTNSHGEPLDGLTLCGSLISTGCLSEATPGRWQHSDSMSWTAAPAGGSGLALKLDSTGGNYGSTSFFAPAGLKIGDIKDLGYQFFLESGSCGGGSPRLVLRVDRDGDGVKDADVSVYRSSLTGCATSKWVHEDLTAAGATWDTSALGGTFYGTQADANTRAGANHQVLSMNLIWDTAGAVVYFDNQRVNNYLLNEPSAEQCVYSGVCPDGSAKGRVIVDSAGAASTITVAANRVTLEGMTIKNTALAAGQAVLVTGDASTIRGNTIVGNGVQVAADQFGVYVQTSGPSGFTVTDNEITDWAHTGVLIGGGARGAGVVSNNVISRNGDNAMYVSGTNAASDTLLVQGNDLRENQYANVRLDTNRAITLRDNQLGLAQNTLSFTNRFPGHTVDARANTWSMVGRDVIGASIADEGNHKVRYMPYLDARGIHHPPMVTVSCLGTGVTTMALDIQDAVDSVACAAGWTLHVGLFKDVEAYDGATISERTLIAPADTNGIAPARLYGGAGGGIKFVAGSEGSEVRNLVIETASGRATITSDGLSGHNVYVKGNRFVGLGTGAISMNGDGMHVIDNEFVGVWQAAVFDNTVGGDFHQSIVKLGHQDGAYTGAAVEAINGATGLAIHDNKIDTDATADQPTYGIGMKDASNIAVERNIITTGNAAGSAGIYARFSDAVTIADNLVTSNIGVLLYGSTNALVNNNQLVVGATGIQATDGQGHQLTSNQIVGGVTGLAISGAKNVKVEALITDGVATGVSLTKSFTTQPSGFVMHNASLAGSGTALSLGSTTNNLFVDAECNDWGSHTAATIRANRIKDNGFANVIDFEPYTSVDSEALGCLTVPKAGFTASPMTAARGQTVRFTDISEAGSRPIMSRAWDFADGNTSTATNPTHAFGTFGTYLVRLTVTDLDGATATALVPIDVVNHAPILSAVGDKTVNEGKSIVIQLAASDADGGTLGYSATGMPAGAALNGATGRFTWSPGYAAAGVYTVTFEVTDGMLTDSETIRITVVDINPAPVFDEVSNKVITGGQTLTFQVRATDPENQPLTMTAPRLPPGATFTATGNEGTFTWATASQQAGTYTTLLSVTDGTHRVEKTVTIIVLEGSGAPVIAPTGHKTVLEGEKLQFYVNGADPDGDAMTFSASNLPEGATFNAAKRLFTWTPNHVQAGDYAVTFAVSDATNTTTSETTITVVNDNRAPQLGSTQAIAAKANRTLTYALPVSDPDGEALSFTTGALPAGMTVNATTGSVTWRPTVAQIGTHPVAFTATDGDLSVSGIATIVVEQNLAPIVSVNYTALVDVLKPVVFRATAVDPEGGSVFGVQWDFNASDGFSPQANGTQATHTFTNIGQYTVTVRVTDEDGFVTIKTLPVTVDDTVAMTVEIIDNPGNLLTSTHGRATVKFWNGEAVKNQVVNFTSYYVTALGTKTMLKTFSATTDANGMADFLVPRDTAAANVAGDHVVEATVNVANTFLGDTESAFASTGYTISA